jgi:hypothetical protein
MPTEAVSCRGKMGNFTSPLADSRVTHLIPKVLRDLTVGLQSVVVIGFSVSFLLTDLTPIRRTGFPAVSAQSHAAFGLAP